MLGDRKKERQECAGESRTVGPTVWTGKGRELADIIERRKIDMVCAGDQLTRKQGQKHWRWTEADLHGIDRKGIGAGMVLKDAYEVLWR